MGIFLPYYWVDDHPLLYGNNGCLDPGSYTLNNQGRGSPFFGPCSSDDSTSPPSSPLGDKGFGPQLGMVLDQ